jgi:hypothetical protein
MRKLLFWALCAATVFVYALMLSWSLPTLSAAAGGLIPFDMRPAGWSYGEARAFLEALSTDGAAFYRDVQHRLDVVYPALLAATLFFAIAALAPKGLGVWRYGLASIALPVAAFDYLENRLVGMMLDAGAAGLSPALAEAASQSAMLKAGSTTAAMLALVVLLVAKGTAMAWFAIRRGPAARSAA